MRSLAKFFTIMGIICECWLVLPLIVGILSIKSIDNAKTKDDLVALAICNMLFCSFLGGLFMLLIPESDFKQNKTHVSTSPKMLEQYFDKKQENSSQDPDSIDLLERYKSLLDKGIITQEEYEQKKSEIMKNCM